MKMTEVPENPDGLTKIHNVRFYNLIPRAIQCMAYNSLNYKLAVCRSDGSIEVWDMENSPFLEKSIAKGPGGRVDSVVWAGERLFTAGLNDLLVEWDLQTLEQRRSAHVTGHAIWCVDRNPLGTELAVGTEEGFINIMDIECDQLQYKHLFDKQEGRVLCCRYDATGKFLVTGSIAAIRIWDVQSGHAIHKINVKGNADHKHVVVWSVLVLNNFQIVSGDSRGIVTVWDGHTAAEVESHKAMKADVLALAVNEEENLLLCSGVEPVIRIYAKTKIKRDDSEVHRFVKFLQRSVHDHDVKALACAGETIMSGGMDGYLGVSQMTKTNAHISRYGPFLQHPCISVASEQRLLLLRYPTYLEVWRLGQASNKPDKQIFDDSEKLPPLDSEKRRLVDSDEASDAAAPEAKHLLALNAQPEKLLEFKSKKEEHIVCAALSPDGHWMCYSTVSEIRLFALQTAPAVQLTRLKVLSEQFGPASQLRFSADSQRLFLVNGRTGEILVFSMANEQPDFVEFIDARQHIKEHIHLLAVSQCGSYVAAAGTDRSIAVWRIEQGKYYRHHLNLPRYPATPTAMAIHAQQPRIVVAFSDAKVYEYDLENMCFTCSDREVLVANGHTHCIQNIVLDPRDPDVFVMQNDTNLFVVRKCPPHDGDQPGEAATTNGPSKKAHKPKDQHKRPVSCLRLIMFKTFEHYIDLAWINGKELVAVGINPVTLIEHLPAAFKQKKFGVS